MNNHLIKNGDFISQQDIECCLLGQFGFSQKLIAHRTKFSYNQITYRLKKFRIRLRDYRNGQTQIAKAIVNSSEKYAVRQLREQVKKQLRSQFKQIGYTIDV